MKEEKQNKNIATYFVLDKIKDAGIDVITDKDEFNRILERENPFQKMVDRFLGTSNNVHNATSVFDESKKVLSDALKEVAIPLKETVYSRENYMQIFRQGIIESPVETIKMGQNQFVRLCPPDRNNLMAAIYETMTKPSIVLSKDSYDENSETFKPIHVYGKSFINEKSNHTRAVESIIIFRDGENIAASLHNKGIEKFIDQIKTADEIIYADKEVSRVATFILKDGDSHVWVEDKNLLSSIEQKFQPLNPKYHTENILSINDLIDSGKILEGKLEITKENFDSYFNIFNQNTRIYKNNRDDIANTLFTSFVKPENKIEMKDWLEKQGYNLSVSKTQKMILQDGKVYGFAHEGKIYLNPDTLNSNVAVHEYVHLWDAYTQKTNPTLWQKGKDILENTSLWNKVKSDPNYADIAENKDLVLSEVHARLCGAYAQKALESIAASDGEITAERAKEWNTDVWQNVCKDLGIEDINTE